METGHGASRTSIPRMTPERNEATRLTTPCTGRSTGAALAGSAPVKAGHQIAHVTDRISWPPSPVDMRLDICGFSRAHRRNGAGRNPGAGRRAGVFRCLGGFPAYPPVRRVAEWRLHPVPLQGGVYLVLLRRGHAHVCNYWLWLWSAAESLARATEDGRTPGAFMKDAHHGNHGWNSAPGSLVDAVGTSSSSPERETS